MSNSSRWVLAPVLIILAVVGVIIGVGINSTLQTASEAEEISNVLRNTYGITVTDNEAVRIQFGKLVEVTGADGKPVLLTLVDTNGDEAPTFTIGTPLEK